MAEVFFIAVLVIVSAPSLLLNLESDDKWIYRKRNALKALVNADLDNKESTPITQHLLQYYKPKKITPELIAYFEKNYPKVLEKEQQKREKDKEKEQELDTLFQELSSVQDMNLVSLKEVQKLVTRPKQEQEWNLLQN